MNVHDYKISFNELNVSKSEIIANIGYETDAIPDYFLENIEIILSKFEESAQLTGGFRVFEKININNKDISINEKGFTTSRIITSALKKSELIAIFACSAGKNIDDLIHSYAANDDMLNSYLSDSIASIVVEKCADFICSTIQKEVIHKSMKITNRFSPGYCNWDVSDQHGIFSLLPDKFCGISLSASAMMTPVKSVSGIIGIGKHVVKEKYKCSSCSKTDCLFLKQNN